MQEKWTCAAWNIPKLWGTLIHVWGAMKRISLQSTWVQLFTYLLHQRIHLYPPCCYLDSTNRANLVAKAKIVWVEMTSRRFFFWLNLTGWFWCWWSLFQESQDKARQTIPREPKAKRIRKCQKSHVHKRRPNQWDGHQGVETVCEFLGQSSYVVIWLF